MKGTGEGPLSLGGISQTQKEPFSKGESDGVGGVRFLDMEQSREWSVDVERGESPASGAHVGAFIIELTCGESLLSSQAPPRGEYSMKLITVHL